MPAEIHVGNATVFRATIKDQDGVVVNCASASTKQLRFVDPTGTVTAKTASFTTDGSDGKIQYEAETSPDFLDDDLAGDRKVQGYVVISSRPYYSDWHYFRVHPNT